MSRLSLVVALMLAALAPSGAAAQPKGGAAAVSPEQARYGEKIRSLIMAARDRRIYAITGKGLAVVSFTIDRKGKLVQIGVAQGSVKGAFDAEAIAIVRRASVWFPAAPVSLSYDYYTFTPPIAFHSIYEPNASMAEAGSITTFVGPRSESRRP